MILAVFLKKDEEILRTEREREEEEEEETGKCVLVQTKPDLLLLRALSFFLVDERRHVGTTLDKRERLPLGVIIRQEQAFGLGIHHHKGRTLAVKSQCLVAAMAVMIKGDKAFLLGLRIFLTVSFTSVANHPTSCTTTGS
ncbi:hypothetical protein BDL97_02G065000 [Sphagnum fallax]|nr:hypothetical protein BDL97_02G065000 [Sphagnum fallax]